MQRRHYLALGMGGTLLALVVYLPDHIIGILAVLVSIPGLLEHVDLFISHVVKEGEAGLGLTQPTATNVNDTVRILAPMVPPPLPRITRSDYQHLRIVWNGFLPVAVTTGPVDKETPTRPHNALDDYHDRPWNPEETYEALKRDYGFTDGDLERVRARYGLTKEGLL